MSKKTDLFDLIHSMSMSEKRYFKLHANKITDTKGKSYLKIFNAIDKQKEYDEQALKKKFAKENFGKHYAVVKNYLLKMIMKSLRAYHATKSNYAKLREMESDAELLVNRGLYDMANQVVEKGIKYATELGLASYKLNFLAWKKRILQRHSYLRSDVTHIQQNSEEMLQTSRTLLNDTEYGVLHQQLGQLMMFQGNYRQEEYQQKLEDFIQHPLLSSSDKALSFRAKATYTETLATYYYAIGDYQKCYVYAHAIYEQWREKLKNNKKIRPESLSPYENYLTACVYSQPYFMVKKELKVFQDFLKQYTQTIKEAIPQSLFNSCFHAHYGLEIEYFTFHCRFKEAAHLLQKSLPAFADKEPNLTDYTRLRYYYLFAYVYLFVGEYQQAQHWLLQLTGDDRAKKHAHVYFFSKMLELLLHYEMGNYHFLKYQVINTRSFLKKQDSLLHFEQAFLRLIRKLMKATSADKEDILLEHQVIFTQLKQDVRQKTAFELLNIIYWIKQQLQKQVLTLNGEE